MRGTPFAPVAAGLLAGVLAGSSAAAAAPPVGARIVWYQIIVEHSGQCLDVAHASTAHAADVVQATCGGPGARGNQTWRFRPVAFH